MLRTDGDALLRKARRHAPSDADAEEALADATLQFLRHYWGPPGPDAVRWMMTVVANYARRTSNHVARWNALIAIDGVDADDGNSITLADERRGPADVVLDSEDADEVFTALARIKHDERVALLLLGVGHSYVEIQAVTGWSRTKVRRCVYEGRRAVRAQLRERGGKR